MSTVIFFPLILLRISILPFSPQFNGAPRTVDGESMYDDEAGAAEDEATENTVTVSQGKEGQIKNVGDLVLMGKRVFEGVV